ncbi:outer membrane lipoprotein carrier protein LolA [Vibrio sinaloensis]|uniref:outer membrane lipoprotein carrier protein LolA n=1 Tax=Photobacterium sp. (strain ATCC 43367) TaxID=379097 RepID=UPI00206CD199|nr:outer membrane lipoprotein carrier protein LolA [Vibrio sinaloensis]UPQ89366.1 outer membrane lipoprotein carrier protein LolA [Vibrio sinaloensis]
MRTCWLALLALSPVCWGQINTLEQLETQLAQHPIVRGEFTQQRHLEMFAEPLSSSGRFTLSKQQGLLWQQNTPFAVNLVLTQDKLRQTFVDQAPQTISAEQNPLVFYFSRVFLAVFHGDTQALQTEFELDFSAQDDQWQLVLTPRQAPLNQVFSTITLSGDQAIDSLVLQELRGDQTEIQFSHQTHQPETLTDAEQAQFSF